MAQTGKAEPHALLPNELVIRQSCGCACAWHERGWLAALEHL